MYRTVVDKISSISESDLNMDYDMDRKHHRINMGVIKHILEDGRFHKAPKLLNDNIALLKMIIPVDDLGLDDNALVVDEEMRFKYSCEVSVTIQKIQSLINDLECQYKQLEKLCPRVYNMPASPWAIPYYISDELATFLGKEKDTVMSLASINKEIYKYIIEHDLMDKTNRIIAFDQKLATLLNETLPIHSHHLSKYLKKLVVIK